MRRRETLSALSSIGCSTFEMKEVQSTHKRKKSGQDYARREVLRMWRHFDEDALKADIPQFCLPSDCLPELFKRYKLDSQREQKQLHYAWEHTMDPEIAAHAFPENIVRGTLFIRVENSSWLSEIVRFHSKDILKKLQACLGKEVINKLSFKAF